jgi:hypothetical protein
MNYKSQDCELSILVYRIWILVLVGWSRLPSWNSHWSWFGVKGESRAYLLLSRPIIVDHFPHSIWFSEMIIRQANKVSFGASALYGDTVKCEKPLGIILFLIFVLGWTCVNLFYVWHHHDDT